MSYELDIVHPATAEWLTANGYTYRHEVKLLAGVVDFVAFRDDAVLIIEVKTSMAGADFPMAINQSLGYSFQYRVMQKVDVIPCLAFPQYGSSKSRMEICQRIGLTVFLFDCMSWIEYNNLKASYHSADWWSISLKMRRSVINTAI